MGFTSFRDTWAEVSLDHLKSNLRQFREFIGGTTKLMAVVKADGYGHGAVQAAQAAISAGASYLGVAILDEAMELRQAGIREPILVLGYTPERSIGAAIQQDITLTVSSSETLHSIISKASRLKKPAAIHLKIDTGMSRIGFTSIDEAVEAAMLAHSAKDIHLEGIFTHFANADDCQSSYTSLQYSRFKEVLDSIELKGVTIPIRHCCNSAATMNFPNMHLDMVRIGIAMYGLYPDPSLKGHTIRLVPAMAFKTRISAIKKVLPNQPASYGCTWVCPHETVLATIPAGYADGISRLLSNRGKVLVNGQYAPIAGRICMDQTIIDVTGIKNCNIGDIVTVFGRDGECHHPVDGLSSLIGTIPYEVVCSIGKRVPRVHIKSEAGRNPLDGRPPETVVG
ncbi:alanine racemase [Bacillus sp. FJAT-27245]|uniref:alanine racemase n=1 Tax=Bacillus sp. FJAT-27245 TaxID=1684144 RepID=UPI0006A7BB18|nr:alanine racemase [Bacillus sp. FJAT-27245]